MRALGGSVRIGVREWPPAAFSVVMGSGITSTALERAGAGGWSIPPLVVALASFVLLLGVAVARLVVMPGAVVSSFKKPPQAFGYFTVVAAASVLAVRLKSAGLDTVAVVFAGFAVVVGVVALYVVPAALVVRSGTRADEPGPDGSWLLWVVALESLCLVVCTVDLNLPAVAAVAFGLWSSGVLLYLILAALVLSRLLTRPMTSDSLLPSYWILSGATAISSLAAIRLLDVRPESTFVEDLRPTITGAAFALWAFGTWWIPLLVALGAWRYAAGHYRARYELGLWNIVFPLGMFSTASIALGDLVALPSVTYLGKLVAELAGVCWALTLGALLVRSGRGDRSTRSR
ncbi:tellurite resistance/C4-dicarboxylate transporter family protein [Kribbella sp. NPDC051770]|uniref:tellurite resistance/C4-dicarboxylate transporter family protein n=1 Tax=Kribbella sp. NPDC051770 TaxID=3155413 RepID=UPI00342B148F